MAYIKLNRENLYHNLNQLSLKSGDKQKIAAVLKDNAYGHGLEQMAKLTSQYGLQEAVVMNQQEASSIKDMFKNILILNDTPQVANNFTYAITELSQLNSVTKGAKIELKVDTGMHRNGIELSTLSAALDTIKSKELNLVGIFTHYKSADEFSSELSWQMHNFNIVKNIANNKGFKDIRFHSHNSAALLRNNTFSEDIARVGIAMYGFNELPSIYNKLELKPVLSLWAKRVSTRELKKGQRVGYGGSFMANKDMLVSTYDVGYGSGLFRGDSTNPLITKDGLPILGRVSMDFISLQSTKDELCIFANAQEVAKHFNTISYEITTSLKSNLKRIVE
jgi:alanine racemase